MHSAWPMFRKLISISFITWAPAVPLRTSDPAISVVIPCNAEDFKFLPLVLASVANQTVLPAETIFVINVPTWASEGTLLLDLVSSGVDSEKPQESDFSYAFAIDRFQTSDDPIVAAFKRIVFDHSNSIEGSKRSTSILARGTKSAPHEALTSLLAYLPPAGKSLGKLPSVKVYARAGTHYAGNNRMYGAGKASHDVIALFDCDDYMHPQKIEITTRLFDENKQLEAMIHSFESMKITQWHNKLESSLGGMVMTNLSALIPFTPEELWNSLPTTRLKGNQSEPNTLNDGYHWWFPKDMHLKSKTLPLAGHNGWLTARKTVFQEVPYPDLPRGQDSLYNWRLLRNKRQWVYLAQKLGIYISFK